MSTTARAPRRALSLACLAAALAAGPALAAEPAARVELGRKLVTLGACADCHTPFKMGPDGPEPDRARHLSGHPEQLVMPPPPALPAGPWLVTVAATNTAWAGPWGVSFTANLTPDAETGLGRWTEQQFVATLRTGRHLGRGRPLLPPMPVPAFTALSDDELGAIFAYLRSIPAVRNRVPEPQAPVAAR